MLIKKLRLQRSWSQEQLADISDLSTRTIQRLERGENASLETLKSLASVFEINVSELAEHYLLNSSLNSSQEPVMNPETQLNYQEAEAMEHVKILKGFYIHLSIFIIVLPAVWMVNLFTNSTHIWAIWPTIGWGAGLLGHSAAVFDFSFIFGSEWEKKQIEKRLGRKL